MEENQRQATKDERARTAMSKDHRATWGRASTRDVAREGASARARVSGGGCEGAGSNARGGGEAMGGAGGENWVGTKARAGVVRKYADIFMWGLF